MGQMTEQPQAQKYRLTNQAVGPRVVYDAHKSPVHLEPGESKVVMMNEGTIKIMRDRDSDVKAAPVSGGEPVAPRPRAPAPERKAAKKVPPGGQVDIPDNWEALPWPAMRKLAVALEPAGKIKNRAEAEAAIRAELGNRGAA